jgi:hypothetical protein
VLLAIDNAWTSIVSLTNNLAFPNNPQNNWYSSFSVNAANNRFAGYTNNTGTTPTTYDSAGDMLTEGSRSYAYDDAGRMTSTGPGKGAYRYDGWSSASKRHIRTRANPGQSAEALFPFTAPAADSWLTTRSKTETARGLHIILARKKMRSVMP